MTVKAEWDRYVATVLSPDVSPGERVEARRAFYAGVASMFDLWILVPKGRSNDEAGAVLKAISDELDAFFDSDGDIPEDSPRVQ